MKKLLLLIAITVFSSALLTAQQVIVTDDASYTTPASGSVLDVKSTTKGFMPPRVALTASNVASPLTSPATGLLVYNTATTTLATVYDVKPGYYYNAGTDAAPNWVQVVNSTGTGTAAVWDDLRVTLSDAATGNVAPLWDNFPIDGPTTNPFIYWFKPAGVDEMYFVVQLPHAWVEGTAIMPHIHWVASEAGTGVPRWGLQYCWLNIGETFTAYTTIYGTTAVPNETLVKDRQYLTPLGSGGMAGTGKTLSSMLICRVFRDGDNAADTYAGSAGGLEIDFHMQINSMGSRLEYTK
jgi:hypothetical protein